MGKVYCGECAKYNWCGGADGDYCQPDPRDIVHSYRIRMPVLVKCSVQNANNDCQHFELRQPRPCLWGRIKEALFG